MWIALRPRSDRRVLLASLDFSDSAEFDLDTLTHNAGHWSEYVVGVAWALQQKGLVLNGWEGVLAGDVPIGAGLSSSAALELAIARAFHMTSDFVWDAAQMALVGQSAENEWVGMNCGIMDQMISAAGEEGHALLIDCRTLTTEAVPLPEGTVAVILDTATRRGLVDSAYNERREQCEAAAAYFDVSHLRDVTVQMFAAGAGEMDTLIRQRARHVITENERVLAAARAMRMGDGVTLGALMNASHDSMDHDFEISSDALNAIVASAQRHYACYGARMTGGGFAGCAVALVDVSGVNAFVEHVAAAYHAATTHMAAIYVSHPAAGASSEVL
jgi:galactokinase